METLKSSLFENNNIRLSEWVSGWVGEGSLRWAVRDGSEEVAMRLYFRMNRSV